MHAKTSRQSIRGRLTSVGPSTAFANIAGLAKFIADVRVPQSPDGFTIDPRSWTLPPFGLEDFVVALCGLGRRLDRLPTRDDVLDWLTKTKASIFLPGRYLGGWCDGRSFYLDVNVRVRGRADAIRFGRRHEQAAIYHPASGSVISVSPVPVTA